MDIYKEALKEVNEASLNSKREYIKRHNDMYKAFPDISKIDEEIKKSYIELSSALIENTNYANNKEIQLRIDTLVKEKELLYSENNINEIYFSNIFSCPICKDTGFLEDGDKCICLKQKLIDKFYNISNLRGVLESENFDTFDMNFYSSGVNDEYGMSPKSNMELAFKVSLDFVKNFDSSFDNLFFYGPTGLGKTFLCNCIAKDLLDMQKSVLYVTAPEIFRKIEKIRFGKLQDDSIEDFILSADLLIIDDLGTEFQTSVTGSEMFNILNSRLFSRKSTIISTNLSLNDVQVSYSDRVVSRLVGNFKLIKFFGEDIRHIKKFNG